jgi:hypothetical protein
MTRFWALMFFAVLFGGFSTALAAPADKNVQHVIGTVTAIDHKHLAVTTPKGLVVSVKLTKHVRFKDKTNPQSNQPPVVGDHVIIEATKSNKVLTATVVHYSPMRQAPETLE